jgi:methionine-rich copper-binding protein CopC
MLVLLLLCSVTTRLSSAQTGRQSASGTYKFIMEDDLTKSVDFSAVSDDKGVVTGSMTFSDEAWTAQARRATKRPRFS